jgi:hypothetical protein
MTESFLQNEINFVVSIDEVYKGSGGMGINQNKQEALPQKCKFFVFYIQTP